MAELLEHRLQAAVKRSLPADLEVAKSEYDAAIHKLLRDARVPASAVCVKPKTVDGKPAPGNPFPEPPRLLTIEEDFGGWSETADRFFDEETGIVPAIQKATGKE